MKTSPLARSSNSIAQTNDDVIKCNFLRYWPFVRGIHRWPVNSPHKGQWRGALMFCLVCAWMNRWENNLEAGYLRRHPAHYDVIVMLTSGHIPMAQLCTKLDNDIFIRSDAGGNFMDWCEWSWNVIVWKSKSLPLPSLGMGWKFHSMKSSPPSITERVIGNFMPCNAIT